MMADGHRERMKGLNSKLRLSKQDEVEATSADETAPCAGSKSVDHGVVPEVTIESDSELVVFDSADPTSEAKSSDQSVCESEPRCEEPARESHTQTPNPKMKLLVRSEALCDDTSPPPDDATLMTCARAIASVTTTITGSGISTLTLNAISPTTQRKGKLKLEKESSEGSMSENSKSPGLSRDSSTETYTDSTGIDLEEFIKITLNKNPKDRQMLFNLEQELTGFINESKPLLKFPPMTSYHRMLVHRVAAFFGLDHNVDQTGKCIVVNKTANTRIPDFKFHEHFRGDGSKEEEPKRKILQRDRDCVSAEEMDSPDRGSLDGKKSKSFEEREEEYAVVRRRIFNQENHLHEGYSDSAIGGRNLLSSGHRDESGGWSMEPRPWSSTDSSGYGTDSSAKQRLSMTKASSFHSVTLLSRPEHIGGGTGGGGGKLSKTDSGSSGNSNLLSTMARPSLVLSSPPPDSLVSESDSTSPLQPIAMSGDAVSQGASFPPFTNDQGQPMAIWVATTLDTIPLGSVLINPQSGQPYSNRDGSVYRWMGPQQQQQQVTTNDYNSYAHSQATTLDQRSYTMDAPDRSQQYAALTPQSSTESAPDIYSPSQAPVLAHQMAPLQQMPTAQPPGGCLQNQQMPAYMTNQAPTSTPAFRYTYPTYMQTMSDPQRPGVELPKAVAPSGEQQSDAQYGGVPQYGCTMMQFPHMTVQAVETYQPQMYPPQQQPPGGQPENYQPRIDAPQFSQAQPVPVYYAPTSNTAAVPQGAPQVMTYASVGASVYRSPRTPPPPPRGCVVAGNPGSIAPVQPQYNMLSYSAYPPQAQAPRNMVPGAYGTIATPVGQQPYPVLRSIGGVAMSLPNRTTPPPTQPYHNPVAMVKGGSPQLKMVAVEQRPPKSAELYDPELSKQMVMCGAPQTGPGGVPLVRVPINGAQYRMANPMAASGVRLVGQPLQQVSTYLTAKPRAPSSSVQPASGRQQQRVRRSRGGGVKDTTGLSPHSSTESTDGCDSCGSNVLEVVGLPATLRQTELPSQLCDLTKLGARLHIVPSDDGAAGDSQGAAECTVIAIFDSDVSAQQALAMHKGSRYRLKPASRCYDIARLERPIS